MSTVKLLSRIVAPSELDHEMEQHLRQRLQRAAGVKGENHFLATLHDHTYGITSDPMTQFACVFAALIHDGT